MKIDYDDIGCAWISVLHGGRAATYQIRKVPEPALRMDWNFDTLVTGFDFSAEVAEAIIAGLIAAREDGVRSGRSEVADSLRAIIGAASMHGLTDLSTRVEDLEVKR
jgi:hypothetical protein